MKDYINQFWNNSKEYRGHLFNFVIPAVLSKHLRGCKKITDALAARKQDGNEKVFIFPISPVLIRQHASHRRSTSQWITYARYVVVGADSLLQKPISDLPGEYRWTFPFVRRYLRHHFRRCDPWFWAADCTRTDRAGFVISAGKSDNFYYCTFLLLKRNSNYLSLCNME